MVEPRRLGAAGLRPIYDIFEGTAEIQQLVISRAISGMHISSSGIAHELLIA